jgi:hypothetical protein
VATVPDAMSKEAMVGASRGPGRRMAASWLLALLALIGLMVIVVSAVFAFRTENTWFDQFWLEVAKGGVQVVAVGVLGGALAATWQIISANREAKLQRNAKIREELASLVALYNEVKAIRRTLRSLGLDLKTYPDDERATVVRTGLLTRAQAHGFQEQMHTRPALLCSSALLVRHFGGDAVHVMNDGGRRGSFSLNPTLLSPFRDGGENAMHAD